MSYLVLAYYIFESIEHPEEEVQKHKDFFENRDVTCRIYISQAGINGQMSAIESDAYAYMEWLRSDPRFAAVDFKIHPHHEQVFPKMTVKVREQLVALDTPVDMSLRGQHLSPAEWRKQLEERDENTVVIDVRNDYEWEIGHFEGAELPKRQQFREFPEYAKSLKERFDPKNVRVMMYCTGGIRCELYSALMRQEGFEQVYQLEGGVIKYGLEEDGKHWKGNLFVFDDRLSVPVAPGKQGEIISHCRFCNELTDLYFNCANVDCNELFLSCGDCAQTAQGCCCVDCQKAPRVRAFESAERPKPYRKLKTQ